MNYWKSSKHLTKNLECLIKIAETWCDGGAKFKMLEKNEKFSPSRLKLGRNSTSVIAKTARGPLSHTYI